MKTVFTNGCFDLLHPGHIDLLEKARGFGDRLVVGINSDRSVRAIKGRGRPLVPEADRALMLKALRSVDEVVIFDESTPERLINEIRPDVLVKGGDWPESEIVGAGLVREGGGEVHSVPLLEGYSSSGIIGRIGSNAGVAAGGSQSTPQRAGGEPDAALAAIEEHLEVFARLADEKEAINTCAAELSAAMLAGGAVYICGNGGSAADAQHMAAELVGRFEGERRALRALALSTDSSVLTAVANDYDFESVFARQIEAFGRKGDALVAISTSGGSENVIRAVMEARRLGCRVIGLTGAGGRKLASLCDNAVLVPATRTSRIQEMHSAVIHIWCQAVDSAVKRADG